jgi:hypothetical protein
MAHSTKMSGLRVEHATSLSRATLLLAWRAKSSNFVVTDAHGRIRAPRRFARSCCDPFLIQSPGVPEEFLGAFDNKHGFVIDPVCFINTA